MATPSSGNCMRSIFVFKSWLQVFSVLVVPGSKRCAHWDTQGFQKTPKVRQSDAPGHPKCIPKVTLGLHGVPRVPPEVSGAPPVNNKNIGTAQKMTFQLKKMGTQTSIKVFLKSVCTKTSPACKIWPCI